MERTAFHIKARFMLAAAGGQLVYYVGAWMPYGESPESVPLPHKRRERELGVKIVRIEDPIRTIES